MSVNDRFIEMEENYLKVDQAVQRFRSELEHFELMIPYIQQLTNYYGSQEWFEHQKIEREGKLSHSTTAVLGEDYAYDTLIELRQLSLEMLEVATNILKQN